MYFLLFLLGLEDICVICVICVIVADIGYIYIVVSDVFSSPLLLKWCHFLNVPDCPAVPLVRTLKPKNIDRSKFPTQFFFVFAFIELQTDLFMFRDYFSMNINPDVLSRSLSRPQNVFPDGSLLHRRQLVTQSHPRTVHRCANIW